MNVIHEVIDGKDYANKFLAKIEKFVAFLKEKHNVVPGLAVILMNDNPASEIYVASKLAKTKEIGMHSFEYRMPLNTSEANLIKRIEMLNNDPKVHGILVQLPLPEHIDENAVIEAVNPIKDVDGFNVTNVGMLSVGQDGFVPCTPFGCMILLKTVIKDFDGLHAVVVGRSNIVGKPMANLLLQKNCTVTIVHSKTQNIKEICKQADILVVAAGKPQLVDREWVKEGAVVIDVGINRIHVSEDKTRLVGDVDFNSVFPHVRAITPVPGGVGPMTIASLMYNTVKAACMQKNIDFDYKL
jgi:methylenetetrahydrofolate dehydrogenase (NADP+)/methenyltetrahydrofolate cyclohydrolase